jgi:Uma2 family endonuclease
MWRGDYFILNAGEDLLTDDFLMRLSARNKGIRMERTAEGHLTIRPPVGGTTGISNAHLTAQLGMWDRQERLGVGFASCIGFRLPNTAIRSPDASWVSRARWSQLSPKVRDEFPPLCPDFVTELVPYAHELPEIREKMGEYIANGARLG